MSMTISEEDLRAAIEKLILNIAARRKERKRAEDEKAKKLEGGA